MFKICVYSICKNEEKNILAWYDCLKDADLIYLLDTGSTDSTIDKIKECKNIIFDQYIQEGDFDFSLNRNIALQNARKHCDNIDDWIFVSLDLDEFLETQGIEKIRQNWKVEYDTYRLCGVTDNDGVQYVDHKVHSNNLEWEWHRSVHEILILPNKPQKEWTVGYNEIICYQHKQDLTKNRDYYNKLLKAYNDNPLDIKTLIYLAWESYNKNLYDDYLTLSKECIFSILNNADDEFYMDYEYLCQCYFNCAHYHELKREYAVADMYLNKITSIINDNNFPPFRRFYYTKAKILWELEQKEIAISYYKKCLEIKERPYCWIDEDKYYDNALIYSEISIAYFYFSKYKEALAYAEISLSLDSENNLLKENVENIRNFILNHPQQDEVKNKICIYAICKNEAQFVEQWLDSMSEADYIVVLDTGSTDGTYELLKNDPRVYKVEQKIITPWRFDTARNESMKLIPDDANILLSTDLDEILEPGWAQVIRDNWIDGFHVRGTYKYAWSHNEKGDAGRIFYYDKLHDKNWYWTAPVHELLHSDIYTDEYRFEHNLDLFDQGVYLHHYPDPMKSRGTYLPLLELRAEENPEDYYGKFYLSHEYHYREMYEKSNNVLTDILTNYRDKYDNLELAACYLFMGDNYRALGDKQQAILNYNLAIELEPSYREPYLLAAELYNEWEKYFIAIAYVQEGLKQSYRHYTWLERDDSWCEKPDDILSIAYYYLGDKESAIRYSSQALEKNPTDERLQNNFAIIAQE